jgi:hypothetical protein
MTIRHCADNANLSSQIFAVPWSNITYHTVPLHPLVGFNRMLPTKAMHFWRTRNHLKTDAKDLLAQSPAPRWLQVAREASCNLAGYAAGIDSAHARSLDSIAVAPIFRELFEIIPIREDA